MSQSRRERLPDGRVLRATLDGVYWVCELEGTGETLVSGGDSGQLSSMMLADLLGYDVDREAWPDWINRLAEQLTRDMCGTEKPNASPGSW